MSGPKLFCLISSFVILAACGLCSTFLNYEIMDQVNAKLPTDQQFSGLGWHYFKARRLLSEYRRLYPSAALDKRLYALSAVSLGIVVAIAWQNRLRDRRDLLV